MNFNIEEIARKYIKARYTKASEPEQEKYIQDWIHKLPNARLTLTDFVKRVGDLKGKTILDMGCGNGAYSIALTEAGAIPTAVEVEKELHDISLENFKAHNISVKSILYDGLHLPTEDNSYDYAISLSVLEHTDDPVIFLKEILRSLKLGGKFYLAYPNKLWPKETHTGLFFLSYFPNFLHNPIIKLFSRNPLEENNLHFYSMFDLQRFVKQINIDGCKYVILHEDGNTKTGIKSLVKSILKIFGLSYKHFMPHVSVILEKVRV